ncbi:MAG: bifunctional oligoribonuclease/PAP phosphatase NrnA [Candidatus Izimaplasma sp.]|nr:bifunctional oligoribonuclease/PAP phosphatase NrnA [Candidatus Izimaplasma bacterium]
MENKIFERIKKYEKIVIHRHKNPDGDAYGSQLGLKRLIELNYPSKVVKVVGDENMFKFLGNMDLVEDEFYQDALVIIVDVAVSQLISDDRYALAKECLVIDHHLNDTNFKTTAVIDPSYVSCASFITDVFMNEQKTFDSLAATNLLTGIVTDSGRFKYPKTNARTFNLVSFLLDNGAELQKIYNSLYKEDLTLKRLRGYFIDNFKLTKTNIAYMKNDKHVKNQFKVDTHTVSRGMVNQMSDIEGIDIWANFTEQDNGDVLAELRSAKEPIVNVAKKYGGGGHALACGCTLDSLMEADKVLDDLDRINERTKQDGQR